MLMIRSYKKKTIDEIKDEYNFNDIKDAFNEGKIPAPLDFLFFGGDNEYFVHACNFLSLNEDNNKLILFSCSDTGLNLITNNSLSIHI